ncbi:hypothetical protein F8388_017754 [Cannabis sativa]|uniref:Glycosyl transferase CAP10 domain-containing protein n=1 Tax=Cannabis sativa TaxID=3483 RepID=A0A7J6E7C6_CANSA|nr:hypothetical protein F8388_017754 [Cannabis sativa]
MCEKKRKDSKTEMIEGMRKLWQPCTTRSSPLFLFIFFLFTAALIFSTRFFDTTEILSNLPFHSLPPPQNHTKLNIPVNCTAYGNIGTCPSNHSTAYNPYLDQDRPLSPTCPEYFRWIYEDLKPWAQTGVTRDMVERAETVKEIPRPEIDIKPWTPLLKEIKEGNKMKKWVEREPYAYWKGNSHVTRNRRDLFKCKASLFYDWKARLYAQDWNRAARRGYKRSNLADQCTHRFKIYIEGNAWSVSHKYILSCNSVTLTVKPRYYDFFARGLIPRHHYWPIKVNDKCRSIKYAVDWGNFHQKEAQEIGEQGSKFIEEELKMDYVYDFMLNILIEYAKLLKYKPTIPPRATELCYETMACQADGIAQEFMMESMEKAPTDTVPCTMPPPYNVSSLASFLERKDILIKEVELWEKKYQDNQNWNP